MMHLFKLNPFIGADGLMRVGGRLRFANIPYNAKHPIILPKNHHVTNLLILNKHIFHLHTGVQQTLYAIRGKYWPIDGRGQIWKVIKNCVNCNKANPRQ